MNYSIKQITKLYESCNQCGLSLPNCICGIDKVKTKAQIWILSSKKELIRASNTARLLKLINEESTRLFIWERTNPPKELLTLIESNLYDVYLLFPTCEDNKERQVEYVKSEKIPAFIIIDGTWQEAKKIIRKSEYLKNIKMLSIKANDSKFELRRGIETGQLCTIETAIETLRLNGELNEANKIEKSFSLFQKIYKISQSGGIVLSTNDF